MSRPASSRIMDSNRGEQSKKIQAIKELHQLDVKVQNMEREKTTHLYNRRGDFRKEFVQMEEMETKMLNDRKAEKSKLKQQLSKIKTMVRKFHNELKDVKPTPEFLEKLKVIMEDIEGTISVYKTQQRTQYEEMMREEKNTTLELTALEKKFESWNVAPPTVLPKNSPAPSRPLASARDITKDLPPEVAAFERFLQQTGGHRGGWDEYDQGTFLKFRARYKGKPGFLRELGPSLPTKTPEEIQQHESWYREYLMLNDRKKEAIAEWKIRKQEEKEEANEEAKVIDAELAKEQHKQQALQEKAEQERQERLKRLNAWKVQKELEKTQQEEKRLQEEYRKAREKEQQMHRKMEMRAQVEVYRTQKEEEEQLKRLEDEMRAQMEAEAKKQAIAKNSERIREKNQKILDQKLAHKRSKEEEERRKQERLERLKSQVQVDVKRDPSRLYQLTEGWKERRKDTGSSGGGQVHQVQHRAVPSWRQGLH